MQLFQGQIIHVCHYICINTTYTVLLLLILSSAAEAEKFSLKTYTTYSCLSDIIQGLHCQVVPTMGNHLLFFVIVVVLKMNISRNK